MVWRLLIVIGVLNVGCLAWFFYEIFFTNKEGESPGCMVFLVVLDVLVALVLIALWIITGHVL